MAKITDSLMVKNVALKNRVVMPPMETRLATVDGKVTQRLIDHYVKRAPYVGLVIVEHCDISSDSKLSVRQLEIGDDDKIEGLRNLAGAVKRQGTPVILQINHSGMRSSKEISGYQPIGPSAVPIPDSNEILKEASLKDIENIKDGFVKAAVRAQAAGFDGVEIHGAHGVLLNTFTTPLINKRTDEYGGGFENRIRLPLEVLSMIKEKVSNDFLIFYRMGADDLHSDGFTVEEAISFSLKLVELGVDVIDVSGGICGSRPVELKDTVGYFMEQAKAVKVNTGATVIGVGGIKDPTDASRFIENNFCDLIAVGRAILKNPHWAKDL